MQEMQVMQVGSLGQKDPLEEEMAPHSSTLAWKIPWTEEPGGLQSMGSQRVGHDSIHAQASILSSNSKNNNSFHQNLVMNIKWILEKVPFHFHVLEKEMATHSSILAWKIPWMEEPGRLQSMGSLRVRPD